MKSRRLTQTVALTCLVIGLGWPARSSAQEQGTPVFGTSVVIPSGLRGLVYFLRPGDSWLPDFSKMKPVGAIYTTTLNVQPQDWSFGFPGVTRRFEWFAIDYRGRFWIDTPGAYEFALTSDDGSKLYIDDKAIINNDGEHEPETLSRRIALDCGIHTIRVSYFQGPRFTVALVLKVSGKGKKSRLFSTEEFKPPANPEDWLCNGVPVPFDSDRRTPPDVSAQSAAAAFENQALEILNADPASHDIPVRSQFFRFWKSAAGVQSSIAVAVPGTSVGATHIDGRASANRVHVAIYGVVKSDDGRTVDKFSFDAPYTIPDRDFAGVREADLAFSHPVHLPVGRYTLETAIMDRESPRTGADKIPIEIPAPRSGIGLSSIVLVDRVEPVTGDADVADPLLFEGKRVVPRLDAVVRAAEKPLVYFVVYSDSSNPAKPALQVQFLVDGHPAAEQRADLPAPDTSGAIPMFVKLTPQSAAGTLKITVSQGEDSTSESLHYRVAAK